MARNSDKVERAAAAEPKAVTLVSPDGRHTETITDPGVANSMIYGMGYKPQGGDAAEAIARVTPPQG